MAITVIHGPMATGKTFHADRFLQHYGCARLLDGWPDDGGCRGQGDPRDGDLILTTRNPDKMRRALKGKLHGELVTFVEINTARNQIGLPLATKHGFLQDKGAL